MIDPRMSRTRWLIAAIVTIIAAVGIYYGQSRRCVVVVHNLSDTPRNGVVLSTSGFRWSVDEIPGESSRSRSVDSEDTGQIWWVHLGQANDAGTEVVFLPAPGRRLIVRIWRDGSIDYDVRSPWWEASLP
ncbi:MAG: hypothetical protein SynsKO_00250 [Synoicihabitans sp.]